MDFNVTEYEKFISRVLYSMQLTFEKSLLIKFWCSIKEECLNYLKRLYYTPILYSTTCLCKYRFSLYSSTKTIYSNKLNVEADENSAIFY